MSAEFSRQPSPVTVPALAVILAALAMIGPFTIDTYLPSFPYIGADLQATPAQMQAIGALPQQQQLGEIAKLAGFPQWAAMRGLPMAKTNACLADPDAPTKLVQMQTDATAAYPDLPGTPSFLLNGKLVEIKSGSTPWQQVETALKAALGG